MTNRFATTRSRQSENYLANLPLLLIDRTACENAVPSPLGCLSFLCLHNRREDMSRLEPGMTRQQVVGLRGRPDVVRSSGAYEQLEYTHRLITGWSWDRSDFKVILKDGRVVEFGHGKVRDRSPQVVYVHSDAASQPERPTIYP
jgi:SmpA/OmlA family protein